MGVHRNRRFRRLTSELFSDVSGATAVEYTLIVVVMALAVFGSMQILREPMNTMFETISSSFAAAR